MSTTSVADMRSIASVTIEPDPRLPRGPASVAFASIPATIAYVTLVASIAGEGIGLMADAPAGAVLDMLASTQDGRTAIRAVFAWQTSLTLRPMGADTFPIGSHFTLFGHR